MTKTNASDAGYRRKARPPRGPDPLDEALGERVRQRRVLLGWSCRDLGETVGVSLQQIRRYELGADRMSAAMLLRLCTALRVRVGDVCAGLDGEAGDRTSPAEAEGPAARLVREFVSIREPAVRSQLGRLVSVLAARSSMGAAELDAE